MSAFLVELNAVADASLRLGTVPLGVQDVHGQLGRHLGAATGTPAAGAVDELLSQFTQALPRYALAGAQLSRAVAGAARDYHDSDTAVAQACQRDATAEQGGQP